MEKYNINQLKTTTQKITFSNKRYFKSTTGSSNNGGNKLMISTTNTSERSKNMMKDKGTKGKKMTLY